MMEFKDFLDVVKRRRSTRVFKPDAVPDEYVNNILEAARWAMSGANGQPWEFILIRDQETKNKLAEAYLWDADTCAKIEMTRTAEYFHPQFRRSDPSDLTGSIHWKRAPVIIAVLGDMRTMQASTMLARQFEEHTFTANLANATFMIHLSAAALGLGAQWVSIIQPMSEMMKPILGVPPVLRLFTLVPIGFPAKQGNPYRRELNEIVHFDKYDMSKYRSQDDIQEFIKFLRRRHSEGRAYPRRD